MAARCCLVEENNCPPAADRKNLLLAIHAERKLFHTSAVPASVTRQQWTSAPSQKLGGRPTGIPPDALKLKASQSISRVLDGLQASPQA